MKAWAWVLALALAVTGGCTWRETKQNIADTKNFVLDTGATTKKLYEEDDTPTIELNYEAADALAKDLKDDLPPNSPISVERFTNEADPADKSPLGRVVSSQVASRLAKLDYKVTRGAPRPVPAPAPPAEGQEPPKELPPRPCILSGTYLVGSTQILVHARVVAVDDDTELSGHDWTLPLNKETREMLPHLQRGSATPSVKTAF
jgi:hypothetical protein